MRLAKMLTANIVRTKGKTRPCFHIQLVSGYHRSHLCNAVHPLISFYGVLSSIFMSLGLMPSSCSSSALRRTRNSPYSKTLKRLRYITGCRQMNPLLSVATQTSYCAMLFHLAPAFFLGFATTVHTVEYCNNDNNLLSRLSIFLRIATNFCVDSVLTFVLQALDSAYSYKRTTLHFE